MNFNKCGRCGCFFVSEGNVCPSCAPKDVSEMAKLNNYFTENDSTISVKDLSYATGISVKNLSRFVSDKNFEYKKKIQL